MTHYKRRAMVFALARVVVAASCARWGVQSLHSDWGSPPSHIGIGCSSPIVMNEPRFITLSNSASNQSSCFTDE